MSSWLREYYPFAVLVNTPIPAYLAGFHRLLPFLSTFTPFISYYCHFVFLLLNLGMHEGFMERLTTLMQQQGFNQYRLAKAIGAPLTTVNGWFAGKTKSPRDKYLTRLAELFHVHPAWLRYGSAEHAPEAKTGLHYLFNEAADYVQEHPEAERYIANALRGIIRGGDFQKSTGVSVRTPKKGKTRRRSA